MISKPLSENNSNNQLKEIIWNIFQIRNGDNYCLKIKSLPKVYSSIHEVKHVEESNFMFTADQNMNQRLRDVKIICDALFDVRIKDKFGITKSIKLGKKFAFRLQRGNQLYINIQQMDLVLLRLMPEETQFPLSNTFLGTCQIFYFLESAIRQCESISSEQIKNKLRAYKLITSGGFQIFGSVANSFEIENQDLHKFEEFCGALRNLGMSDEQICDYLEILIAIILFGGFKQSDKQLCLQINKLQTEIDISASISTLDQTNEIMEINFSQLLKLHKKIDNVQEIENVENKQTAKIYLQCKDKLRGSQNYLYQQLYEWTLKKIHGQNPPKDLTLHGAILFEKQTPIAFVEAEKPNPLYSFVDFIQNFSIDYVMTNLCQKNENLKQQVKDITQWFEKPQDHQTQDLIVNLQKYSSPQLPQNALNNSNIKLQHSFGLVSYNFFEIQKYNHYQLNEQIQDLYRKSENFILKNFEEVNGQLMKTMITSIISNLKDYIICSEPVRNHNSNSSSPRYDTPFEQACKEEYYDDNETPQQQQVQDICTQPPQ